VTRAFALLVPAACGFAFAAWTLAQISTLLVGGVVVPVLDLDGDGAD